MKKSRKSLIAALCAFIAFILWTAIVCLIDVKQIGPDETSVGLATINEFVHGLTGIHFSIYNITDWLGLIPVCVCLGFGFLGLFQLIKRKSIKNVDFDIIALGCFYVVTIIVYLLFEYIVINYRPVIINGNLEVSYPSSTTLLTMCVMPTAAIQFQKRVNNVIIRKAIIFVIITFTAFMVIGRLLSGVHWFSDIIGGIFISAGLVLTYYSVINSDYKQN